MSYYFDNLSAKIASVNAQIYSYSVKRHHLQAGEDLGIYLSNGEFCVTPCPSMLVHSVKERERVNDGQS